MCGRYNIITDAQALYDAYQVEAELAGGRLARYNVAPATDQLVILCEDGRRAARWHRWGLIPRWAKDPAIAYKTINARGESVAAKPAFRAAFRQRRCLVPASGFYEWKVQDGGKQPYLIRPRGGGLLSFAGLWEIWAGPEGEVRSFTIITTEPNELMATLHNRMPVILHPSDYARWLDPAPQTPADLQPLLRPFPAEDMSAHPVGTLVNSPGNDRAELVVPV